MKKLLLFAAAVALLLVTGCKKGPAVESVTVIPAEITLNIGEHKVLAANIEPFSLSDEPVTWSSSDPAVATVSQKGRVTAVGHGQAVITATVGGKSGSCNVEVLLVSAIDLGLPSGTLWADRNVGADNPSDYGNYFSWGEIAPKESFAYEAYKWFHQDGELIICDKYSYEDARLVLAPEDDPATALLGEGWRMPTVEEWYELFNETNLSWDAQNKGLTCSGDGKSIFLPTAGCNPQQNDSQAPGIMGSYWALSRVFDDESAAERVWFDDDYYHLDTWGRPFGCSVRAVRAPYVSVTGISFQEGASASITGSGYLTAIIEPEDALEKGIRWSSSNTEVATVNVWGEIVAVSDGVATITATTADGGFTASCEVTIVTPKDLTVYGDGGTSNGYVPIYGFYADAYLKSEMVYPAGVLAAMTGRTIQEMRFYATQSAVNWNTSFKVFLKEVSSASIDNFYGEDGATVVYEGGLSIANSELVIPFTTPYTYHGGNLLVGVYQTNTGSYFTSTWCGKSVTGASVQGYSYSSLDSINPTQRDFLPTTCFKF